MYIHKIITYLMRDVAKSSGITDTVRFCKFLVGCAALSGSINRTSASFAQRSATVPLKELWETGRSRRT